MPAPIPAAVPSEDARGSRSSIISLVPRKRIGGPRFDVLFVGDTCFGESYQEGREAKGTENILKARGYDAPVEGMMAILRAAGFVVANLETPVTDLAASPFSGRKRYVHRADVVETPRALTRSRVAAVSLANNHSFDYGPAGLEQTLEVLAAEGIACFGAALSTTDAVEPFLLDLNGGDGVLRIAVFGGYDRATGARAGQEAGQVAQFGSLDPVGITERVRQLRAVCPNLLAIAFPHWGRNYEWSSQRQRRLAGELFDAGIDLILGHGAHMLQEVESRGGRCAAFGLGNFVFNSPGRYGKHAAPPFGLVARLVARPRPRPRPWSLSLRLYPIVTDNKLTNYQTRVVNDEEFQSVRELLAAKSKSHHPREGQDSLGRYLRFRVRPGQNPDVGLAETPGVDGAGAGS